MPIVDGFSSTKMIRSYEKTKSAACLSARARLNGRIPIFAVSASLEERDREKYIETGFDGWILKPVDFKRVNDLLRGIVQDETRNQCLYCPGKWEQGGWFDKRSECDTAFDVETTPNEGSPTTGGSQQATEGQTPSGDSEGSITPTPVPDLPKAETV